METLYQKVANILVNIIPEKWVKIYLYAEFRDGYEKVFFYYYPENRLLPIYSLDITDLFNVDDVEFDKLENELYASFSELLEEFKIYEQEQWTYLTYILDNTGEMKINYGYENVSQICSVQKQDEWEDKYLK